MTVTQFSKDLASIVHHVELSEAGWRDRALDLMCVSVLHSSGSLLEQKEVRERLNAQLPSPLAAAQVSKILERLFGRETVVRLPNGKLQLADVTEQQLWEHFRDAERLTERVRSKFTEHFPDSEDSPSIQWADFEAHFLTPLIVELGARTFEFLSGEDLELTETDSVSRYLDRFPPESRSGISSGISAFLSPQDPDVRSFVLRLLNATFLVQATTLSESALNTLLDQTTKQLKLTIFVDTNFLFSLIGLHENPADDVVDALRDLMKGVGGRVEVSLYIIPDTVDEAKHTIGLYEDRLSGFHLDKHLARAVRDGTADLSGITMKFIREAAASDGRLTSQEYFRPYHDNLIDISRGAGVELYNEDTSTLHTDQGVIDDVQDEMEFQKRIRGDDAKRYELVRHDIVLWHCARRKRAARVESPMEARYWVATLDYGLLRFDRYKRKRQGHSVPVCMHPTVLLQILQLWIPRTEKLEAALMDSLRPLLPHVFDRDAERVTIRILKAMSRFEDAGDLSSRSVKSVLLNKAVRARVGESEEEDEQFEVVRDAIIEENRRLDLRSKQLEQERAGLAQELRSRERELEHLSGELATATEYRDEAGRLARALREERSRSDVLEERVGTLEGSLAELERKRARKRAYGDVAIWSAVSLVGMVAFGWLTRDYIARLVGMSGGWMSVVLSGVVIGVGMMIANWRMTARFEGEVWAVRIRRATKAWWAILGTVGLGVVANVLYQAMRTGGP